MAPRSSGGTQIRDNSKSGISHKKQETKDAATNMSAVAKSTNAANPAPVIATRLSVAAAADGVGVSVLASVCADDAATRHPVDVCVVIDISGSMADEVKVKNADGSTEAHGLTILDIVKHATRTIIESLADTDRLSLVAYSNEATTVLALTPMLLSGKAAATAALEALQPTDSTNLWAGLLMGLENLRTGSTASRVSTVLLLTDGQPNIAPPRGHLPMLQRYRVEHAALHCTINTFGFGYNLDSQLLSELAVEGDGAYAFIPDAGFVGTVFVHAVANVLVTAARGVHLTLTYPDGGTFAARLGAVALGQSRDVVLQLPGADATRPATWLPITARLRFVRAGGATVEETTTVLSEAVLLADTSALDVQWARLQAVAAMEQARGRMTRPQDDADGARAVVAALRATLRASRSVNNPSLLTLLEDLDGQVTEALSRPEFFTKWGRHYLPSLQRAHELQACNNFKDPGVQGYGGALFRAIRDQIDELFCKLPPPKPSAQKHRSAGSGAPAPRVSSMASYNSRGNACFAGGARVALERPGSTKAIQDLRRGDVLAGGAVVRCVVQTLCADGRAALVALPGGLLVTPYHPVRIAGAWTFPLALAPAVARACPAVFSLVLSHAHVALIDGVECCTLGHGFTDSPVIAHPYLGTRRVVDDLARLPGWAAGRIVFRAGWLLRPRATRGAPLALTSGIAPEFVVI